MYSGGSQVAPTHALDSGMLWNCIYSSFSTPHRYNTLHNTNGSATQNTLDIVFRYTRATIIVYMGHTCSSYLCAHMLRAQKFAYIVYECCERTTLVCPSCSSSATRRFSTNGWLLFSHSLCSTHIRQMELTLFSAHFIRPGSACGACSHRRWKTLRGLSSPNPHPIMHARDARRQPSRCPRSRTELQLNCRRIVFTFSHSLPCTFRACLCEFANGTRRRQAWYVRTLHRNPLWPVGCALLTLPFLPMCTLNGGTTSRPRIEMTWLSGSHNDLFKQNCLYTCIDRSKLYVNQDLH